MTFEITLIIGGILAVLSVVAVLSALIEGRRPRVASVVVVISGGLLVWAGIQAPPGFGIADVPLVFVTVVAAILK